MGCIKKKKNPSATPMCGIKSKLCFFKFCKLCALVFQVLQTLSLANNSSHLLMFLSSQKAVWLLSTRTNFRVKRMEVQYLTFLITSYVTLGKLLNLSELLDL